MSKYTDKEMAMLYDDTKCTACKACQVACKQWNVLYSPLGLNEDPFTGSYQSPMDLGPSTSLVIQFQEKKSDNKFRPVEWAFGRRSCFHCTDAGCVTVCPTGALSYAENGVVQVKPEKCIGCNYCNMACPFDVPRYWGPERKIDKCTMCYDRLENGRKPACVTTCQPEALHFGPREEMIKLGKERVAIMKEKGYDKCELYGENEMSGLHILQVCKYGHEASGLPTDPSMNVFAPLAKWTRPLAGLATAATVIGLGISYFMNLGYKRKPETLAEAKESWTPAQRKTASQLVAAAEKKLAKKERAEDSTN
ncbi:MAG: 4Fe-4S dicluster domain-containing protein [Burkholderiales bacterium]|nr:4Fe-4S dicluster domain-containing protein [Burkholderiales bacterium]